MSFSSTLDCHEIINIIFFVDITINLCLLVFHSFPYNVIFINTGLAWNNNVRFFAGITINLCLFVLKNMQ